jgi:hypothetical protein
MRWVHEFKSTASLIIGQHVWLDSIVYFYKKEGGQVWDNFCVLFNTTYQSFLDHSPYMLHKIFVKKAEMFHLSSTSHNRKLIHCDKCVCCRHEDDNTREWLLLFFSYHSIFHSLVIPLLIFFNLYLIFIIIKRQNFRQDLFFHLHVRCKTPPKPRLHVRCKTPPKSSFNRKYVYFRNMS